MAATALAEFIDELVYQLIVSNRVLSRQPDVSNCGFRALMFVKHSEGASIRQVADFLGVTLPRASNVIDELSKKELLRRESSEDRRRAAIYLTTSGRQVAENLHLIHAEVAKRILLQIPSGEQRNLGFTMEQCTAALRSTQAI